MSNLSTEHSDKLVDRHDAQLQCDTKGCTLPELPVGSTVGYRNHVTNKIDVGIVSARDARSYTILTENGSHISRNCIDLKCTSVQFEPKTRPDIFTLAKPVVSTDAKSKHVHANPQPPTNIKCTGKANLIEKEIDVRKTNVMCIKCAVVVFQSLYQG